VNYADVSGVLVKIDRARAHLDDFDAQARLITEACRRAIIRERDEQRSEHVFRFGRVPAVPPVLSAIIGDAIHNLRVSLDHLAWQLVIATGNQPNKNTSFPILRTAATPDRWGRTRPQISPGVPEPAGEILDEVQPYRAAVALTLASSRSEPVLWVRIRRSAASPSWRTGDAPSGAGKLSDSPAARSLVLVPGIQAPRQPSGTGCLWLTARSARSRCRRWAFAAADMRLR
jgi:hypothetical protein